MKFEWDNCIGCGESLVDVEPGEITRITDEHVVGTCPNCGQVHRMVEVSPEASGAKAGRRRR